MATDPECLFCRIVAGQIPAEAVAATERTFAFRDISPAAPTHVLVVPREHYATVAELGAADPALLAEVVATARDVAEAEGVATTGYRLVFNSGPDAGQTVFHVHGHVLGGQALGHFGC